LYRYPIAYCSRKLTIHNVKGYRLQAWYHLRSRDWLKLLRSSKKFWELQKSIHEEGIPLVSLQRTFEVAAMMVLWNFGNAEFTIQFQNYSKFYRHFDNVVKCPLLSKFSRNYDNNNYSCVFIVYIPPEIRQWWSLMGILLSNFHWKYDSIHNSRSCIIWEKYSFVRFKVNAKKIIT